MEIVNTNKNASACTVTLTYLELSYFIGLTSFHLLTNLPFPTILGTQHHPSIMQKHHPGKVESVIMKDALEANLIVIHIKTSSQYNHMSKD